jgi:hypothetical protein
MVVSEEVQVYPRWGFKRSLDRMSGRPSLEMVGCFRFLIDLQPYYEFVRP